MLGKPPPPPSPPEADDPVPQIPPPFPPIVPAVNDPEVALMVYVPGAVNCAALNVATPATADALVVPAKVAEPLTIVLDNEIVPVYSTSTVLSARCACTVNEVRLFETKPVVGGATLNTNLLAAAKVVIDVAVV